MVFDKLVIDHLNEFMITEPTTELNDVWQKQKVSTKEGNQNTKKTIRAFS